MDRPEPVTVYVLEALYKGEWTAIRTNTEKEVLEAIKTEYITTGIAADDLRITESTFNFRGEFRQE